MFFKQIERPTVSIPDVGLDEELQKEANGASLKIFFVNMVVVSGHDLLNMDFGFDLSDPYCEVQIEGVTEKTETIQNDLNPVWNKRMSFFVPKKPEKITFKVWDENVNMRDDFIGQYEFLVEDMFENKADFDGKITLTNEKKKDRGSIHIKFSCDVMKPILTDIKLQHTTRVLEGKIKENEEFAAAFDESEKLRDEAISELSMKEQKIIKQAQDIADDKNQFDQELTSKQTRILNQAQKIEEKIQEMEETAVALKEAELKKQETEMKLTEAEKAIIQKGEELEEKQRQNDEALTAKEMEILATAEKLEEKEQKYNNIMKELEQNEALKKEIENELTAKETIILDQALQLEEKAKQTEDLSEKERELLAIGATLKEREHEASEAQKVQDKIQSELNRVMKENNELQNKVVEMKTDMELTNIQLKEAKETLKKNDDSNQKWIELSKKSEDEIKMLQKEIEGLRKAEITTGLTCGWMNLM